MPTYFTLRVGAKNSKGGASTWQLAARHRSHTSHLPIFPCQPLGGFCNFRPARCCAKRKSQSIQVASPGKSATTNGEHLYATMLQEIFPCQSPSSGKSFSSSSKLRRACSSEWCFSRKVSWSHSCWSSVLKIHQNSSKCTTAHLSNRDENKSTNVSPCQILLNWFSNMFNMRNQVSYIFNQVTICSSDIARWRNWPEKVRRIGRGISKPWWCRCNIQKKKQIQKIQLWFLVGYKWYKPAREEISIQFFSPNAT